MNFGSPGSKRRNESGVEAFMPVRKRRETELIFDKFPSAPAHRGAQFRGLEKLTQAVCKALDVAGPQKIPAFPGNDPVRHPAGRVCDDRHTHRLRFDNQSDETHPVHLHRHSFEITKFAGKATTGVVKDVVVVPARKQVEVDFTADNPGPTLFHCHQQLHMDYGFMTMMQYEG